MGASRMSGAAVAIAAALSMALVGLANAAPASAAAGCDFNGDGYTDVPIGVPNDRTPQNHLAAGAVNVIYGGAGGLHATSTGAYFSGSEPGTPGPGAEENDGFGTATTCGDFNGDGYADLAVSAPFKHLDDGAVYVFRGSAAGLTTKGSQYLTYGNSVWGAGAAYGISLATVDLNSDGYDELIVGAPYATPRTGDPRTGSIQIWRGSTSGLTRWESWARSSTSLSEADGDQFGWALATGDFNGDHAGDIAIGAPGVNGQRGDVTFVYSQPGYGPVGSTSNTITQNTSGVPGVASPGNEFGMAVKAADFNGDGKADIAVGSPLEFISSMNRGAVTVLKGSAGGVTSVGSTRISASNTNAGYFGSALAAGQLNGINGADLAVGTNGDVASGLRGQVDVYFGDAAGLHATPSWTSSTSEPGYASSLMIGQFGRTAVGGRPDLAIGVTNETVQGVTSAGAVDVYYGGPAGIRSASNLFSQANLYGVPEQNDYFGFSLP